MCVCWCAWWQRQQLMTLRERGDRGVRYLPDGRLDFWDLAPSSEGRRQPKSTHTMALHLVVSVLLACLFVRSPGFATAKDLPSYIKTCRRSDPKLNECIKDTVELLKPYLAKGIPELDVPPCEPFIVPELVLNQGKGAVSISSTYSDINVWGGTNFLLKYIKVDLDHNRIRLKVYIPAMFLESDYEMSGRILMLPIVGKGRCYSNYTDVDVSCDMNGHMIKRRDGKQYYQVTDLQLKFDFGTATMHLSDLFNGDEQLGAAMNTFLNENFKTVTMEIRPLLEESIGETVKKMSNKFFGSRSIDILLPD